MANNGDRFKLGSGMAVCPQCLQYPARVNTANGVKVWCDLCGGLGQIPAELTAAAALPPPEPAEMIVCPTCQGEAPIVTDGRRRRPWCPRCGGAGHVPVGPYPGIERGTRSHRMKVIHTLAWYVVGGGEVFEWEEGPGKGVADTVGKHTKLRLATEVDHVRFWRTWSELGGRKGWKP